MVDWQIRGLVHIKPNPPIHHFNEQNFLNNSC